MLAIDQIKELLVNPKKHFNYSLINEMIRHDNLLHTFCTGENTYDLIHDYSREFVEESRRNVKTHFQIISKDFLNLNSGVVYSHFSKIFDTQDSPIEYVSFAEDNETKTSSLQELLRNAFLFGISDKEFYQNILFKDSLSRPNTRYIVDYSNENPNVFRIPTENILVIEENEKGLLQFICKFEKKQMPYEYQINKENPDVIYYQFDNEKRTVWHSFKSREPELVLNLPNNLGYIPVFSASIMHGDHVEFKKSIISDSIPALYNYVLYWNMINLTTLECGMPMRLQMKKKCDGEYDQNQDVLPCQDGFIFYEYELNGELRNGKRRCQTCERRKLEQKTFGQIIEVPREPLLENNFEGIIKGIKEANSYTDVPLEWIKSSREFLETDKLRIIESICGEGFNRFGSAASFNEKQIEASFDSKESILIDFGNKMSLIRQGINATLARMVSLDLLIYVFLYGTEFFFEDKHDFMNDLDLLEKSTGDGVLKSIVIQNITQANIKKDRNLAILIKVLRSIYPFAEIRNEIFMGNIAFFMQMDILQTKLRLNFCRILPKFFEKKYEFILNAKQTMSVIMDKTKRFFIEELKVLDTDNSDYKQESIIAQPMVVLQETTQMPTAITENNLTQNL
jgi:hypothetical protein